MIAALLLVAGLAVLGYVVRRNRPRAWELALAGAIAGAATFWFVVARRAAAAGALAVPTGWAAELLTGGAALPHSPYLGLERAPALALWMLTWAAFLYDDRDPDEERGPAVLALVPPILVVMFLTLGPATEHGRSAAAVTIGLLAVAITVVLLGRLVVRHLRRSLGRK